MQPETGGHSGTWPRERIANFAEVYLTGPQDVCQDRETSREAGPAKENLYEKARTGRLGGKLPCVTATCEVSKNSEVVISTLEPGPRESAEKIMAYIKARWVY